MVWTQSVADVGLAALELDVSIDEVVIDRTALDDVMADVVEDGQIRARLEDHAVVGQFERAVFKGRKYVHFRAGLGQTAVGDPAPQDRMHLGHVRTPQHEHVGVLDVVVAAHRLVDAECAHEARDGRGHAMARIGIDVVAAEPGLVKFCGGIAFPHRPLAGSEHPDRTGPVVLEGRLPLFFHDVEGLFPRDRGELAVLVVLAVLHAQHGLGETIRPVHDLGQEVALDAVQSPIDRRIRIALGCDHPTVLHPDEHRAAHAAKSACSLVPTHTGRGISRLLRLRHHRNADAGRCRRGRNRIGLDEFTSIHVHVMPPVIRDLRRYIRRPASRPVHAWSD